MDLKRQDTLLNEAEMAELLGLNRTTIWRARKAGKLSFYRLGSRILYSPKHVNEFLASHEQNANKHREEERD